MSFYFQESVIINILQVIPTENSVAYSLPIPKPFTSPSMSQNPQTLQTPDQVANQ